MPRNYRKNAVAKLITDRGIDDRELFFKLSKEYGRTLIPGLTGDRSSLYRVR